MAYGFQISVLNLRPYTLSILMWRPQKKKNEIRKGSQSLIAFGLTHRRPLYFFFLGVDSSDTHLNRV